jgi:hypothetical protein
MDPDPHQIEMYDRDPHQIEMYDPDPHQCDTDPLRQLLDSRIRMRIWI